MTKYNFPVPRPRGFQPEINCDVVYQGRKVCTKDIILWLLLGRYAGSDGTTHEFETIFNPELNAIDVDIPEHVLQQIESIQIGPNLQRYIQWLVSIINEDLDTLLGHVNNTNNPHNTTAAQVDADPIGSAAAVQMILTNHIDDSTIHFTVPSISHTLISDIGTYAHTQIDAHINNISNPHTTTLEQVRSQDNVVGGPIDLDGNYIINAPVPQQDDHVANKQYVDSVASGLSVLDSARVATISNLSATYAGGQLTSTVNIAISIDNIPLSQYNRVLVKDQTDKRQNGVYFVSTVGDGGTKWVLTRSTDFDESSETNNGTFIFITEGDTNANTGWVVTSQDPITLDTDDIIWSQFSATGNFVAGDGLDRSGNIFFVVVDNTTIEINSDALRIKDGGVTNTKLDKINIPLSGFGAALANIDFGGFKAINVANPVAATDAANKQYVNWRFVTVTDDYTAEFGDFVLADTSTKQITVRLPAVAGSATSNTKPEIVIKKISSDGRKITIDPNGAETIDGSTTATIDGYNDAAVLATDGSRWYVH